MGGAGLIVIERGCVSDCDNASVTLTVKFEVPVLVGVPEMFRPSSGRDSRGAIQLDRLQTSVPVPPVACNVWL